MILFTLSQEEHAMAHLHPLATQLPTDFSHVFYEEILSDLPP